MTYEPAMRDIYVEANGLRHHLLARGRPDQPAVVMIHGLTGQAHTFDAIAARLAARWHVYCLDVRGRGESDWGPPDGYFTDNYVKDLEAVRQALGLHRFALVGTSMGGIIGMHYASLHPECVSHLVLNDIGPEIDPAGLARIAGYVGSAPTMFPNVQAVVAYYRDNYQPILSGLDDVEIAEYARWHVRKNDVGVYVWKMDPTIRQPAAPRQPATDPWEAVRRIACPALIIRGGESDVLSRPIAERMVREMKAARLVEVPGVGHAPLLIEADAVEALESFLAE